mgnify:CR=1 FL=1
MGQQQLLLVILVTIIVGIATVVAINTFSAAADSANVDAARQDALSIAAAAQQYYMKPTALGGGGQTFTDIDFSTISGVPVDRVSGEPTQAVNQNGSYVIAPGSDSFTITVYPSSCYDGSSFNEGCSADSDISSLTATVRADEISWTG